MKRGGSHDRTARRYDLRCTRFVVAGFTEPRQVRERAAHGRGPLNGRRRRPLRRPVEKGDQEHALTRLRDAVVVGVEQKEGSVVAELLGAIEQPSANVLPSWTRTERLDVLHDEGPRSKCLDDIEEMIDVLAPRIVRIHAADHRKTLARRPSDHEVGANAGRRVDLQDIAAKPIRLQVCVVGLDREPVAVDRPSNVEPGPRESKVETSGPAVQRDRAVGRGQHAASHSV